MRCCDKEVLSNFCPDCGNRVQQGRIDIPDSIMSLPISAAAKMVYGKLRSFQGDGDKCNPSHAMISNELGISTATVRRAIGALIAQGALSAANSGRGMGVPNTYHVRSVPAQEVAHVSRK